MRVVRPGRPSAPVYRLLARSGTAAGRSSVASRPGVLPALVVVYEELAGVGHANPVAGERAAGREAAGFGGIEGIEEGASSLHDGYIARAEVLLAAVDDGAHAGLHRGVLFQQGAAESGPMAGFHQLTILAPAG